jgi:hypothetical protein
MFDFFFKYFLLFPKLQVWSHWGILIGEIVMIFYLLSYVAKRNSIRVNSGIVVYYIFTGYFVLISSLIAGFFFSYVPLHSIFYFIRLVLYLAIFLWAMEYYRKHASDNSIIKDVFNRPFTVHFIICFFIMIVYYSTHSPSTFEILWVYQLGIRMIPLAGLVIDMDSFMFLKAISGSANLLSGWALAILILNFNFGEKQGRIQIVIVAIATILLTVSRGGFLTIVIYLVYVWLKRFDFKISIKPFLIGAAFLTALILYFSLAKETPLPNIFDRLTNTYESGTLDASSQGRFDKYSVMFNAWSEKLRYVILGLGFDEEIRLMAANETIIDSFFLEVLFCSGIIGIAIFPCIYIYAFLKRKQNYWYKSLFEFLIFQSIVSWSITGGDFLAPHATYILMTFLGFGYASEKNEKYQS